MVKARTEYICEVCNHSFKTPEEASEHEKIPVVGEGLPEGFVFKNDWLTCVVHKNYIENSGKSNSNHQITYDCWVFAKVDKEKHNFNYFRNCVIPGNLSDILLSDEELIKVKEILSKTSKTTLVVGLDLEKLTNKLPEGYQHISLTNLCK